MKPYIFHKNFINLTILKDPVSLPNFYLGENREIAEAAVIRSKDETIFSTSGERKGKNNSIKNDQKTSF
jgi:hypothetical protein